MPIIVYDTVATSSGSCAPISSPAAPIAAPFDIGGLPATVIAAPIVVAPNAYSDMPPFPLSHPRILYNNLLITGVVTDAPAAVLTPSTFDRWTFTTAVSAVITLAANATIDTVALGACQIAGRAVLIEYDATTGGTFAPFAASQVNSQAAMMFFADPISVRRIRVTVLGSGAGSIGVISAGVSLQMQHAIYGGVNPITLNRVTDYFSNKSEAGEWLGRQVRRRGLESSLSFSRLTAPWYRQYFDPFVKSAITTPFFFAWRPSEYPAEVAYCWTESDIQPSNSGGATNHMAVQFSVKAHA